MTNAVRALVLPAVFTAMREQRLEFFPAKLGDPAFLVQNAGRWLTAKQAFWLKGDGVVGHLTMPDGSPVTWKVDGNNHLTVARFVDTLEQFGEDSPC